ncbi:hypothetical protein PQI23_02955 [Leucobacter sp. USCH14]|uniref:hypothetical protein n=1 Tax=Leucobacter sp. USCH14 TaxID=3024838 RepID=UPI0030966C81
MNAMNSLPSASQRKATQRTPAWARMLLFVVVTALIVGAGVVGVGVGTHLGAEEERSVQVLRSVKGEEQVILVTAGLSEIKPQKENQNFFGLFDIPFSDREVFMQYDFDAKFGIEGKDVEIRPTGEMTYTIEIPEFIFLGYNDPNFTVATESNGILSWVTPEIDKTEAIEEILTDAQITEQVAEFRPLLEAQAETFYTRIVSSIEPDAVLTFEFAE